MRKPEKATRVYESLRNRILRQDYVCGSQLPKEVELAQEYGVSRDTLRHALELLSADSLIQRVQGCGTFISESLAQENVTFLLPSLDQLGQSNTYLEGVFKGVLKASKDYSCHIETIPVSPSNDAQDIDWKCLFNLDSRSRVLVTGTWFSPLFPYLRKKGCRVAVVHDELRCDYPSKPEYASWYWLTKSREIERRMIRELFRQGSRRPLFILAFLEDPDSYLREDIEELWSELCPDVAPRLVCLPAHVSEDPGHEELLRREFVSHGCDGFLLNTPYLYQLVQRHYPEYPCGMFNLRHYSLYPGGRRGFYSEMPNEAIGYKAVELLLQDSITSAHLCYGGKIIHCQ